MNEQQTNEDRENQLIREAQELALKLNEVRKELSEEYHLDTTLDSLYGIRFI